MNRREFLATASAAALTPALPLAPTAPQVGIDLASGPSSTVFYISTPTSDGSWVWEVFDEARRDAEAVTAIWETTFGETSREQ